MKKVQHFILTRFNLRLVEVSADLDSDKFGNKIDRDQWLLHRFELFERYCLPSMAAQANQDFRWFLFFDEATSALDNRTQAMVTKSLEQLQSTRVVIAHRLSTIKNADCIYAIDHGNLIESGTYDELMQRDGYFAKLAKRQIA